MRVKQTKDTVLVVRNDCFPPSRKAIPAALREGRNYLQKDTLLPSVTQTDISQPSPVQGGLEDRVHGSNPRSPVLEPPEAVADNDHLRKGIHRPVPPQQVVVQRRPAVRHVEDGGLPAHAPLPFLGSNTHEVSTRLTARGG